MISTTADPEHQVRQTQQIMRLLAELRDTTSDQISNYANSITQITSSKDIINHIAKSELEEARDKLLEHANIHAPHLIRDAITLSQSLEEISRDPNIYNDHLGPRLALGQKMFDLAKRIDKEAQVPAFMAQHLSTLIGPAEQQPRRPHPATVRTERALPKDVLEALRALTPANFITVQAQNVEKSYSAAEFKIGPISLELNRGEITAIVGANASGKSTLLKIISATLGFDSGDVTYPALKPYAGFRELRSKIGYVPQELSPWSGKLKDNLHYFGSSLGLCGERNIRRVEWVIERLRLGRFADLTWPQISGGYKLRFDLGRAILTEPALLLLDEPLSHLDVNAQAEFLFIIKSLSLSLKNPMSVVITSQHIHEVERVADRIIVLDNGSLRYDGLAGQIKEQHHYSIFDISCEATYREAIDIFGQDTVIPHTSGDQYILRFENHNELHSVAATLKHRGIETHYLRDISSSSRLFFESWFLDVIRNRSSNSKDNL